MEGGIAEVSNGHSEAQVSRKQSLEDRDSEILLHAPICDDLGKDRIGTESDPKAYHGEALRTSATEGRGRADAVPATSDRPSLR